MKIKFRIVSKRKNLDNKIKENLLFLMKNKLNYKKKKLK